MRRAEAGVGGQVDVVVVGAGHAGCEAAAAAARLGRSVVMVALRRDHVGRLSCNPAVGGLAKGHLVRELDALGGLMAKVADASTVQFRHLNTRKGLAVRSSRAQVDVALYPQRMAAALAAVPGLTLIEGEVVDLVMRGNAVGGVVLADGAELHASAVILTTGTFLGGVMHRGEERTPGGRVGDGAASALSARLTSLGLRLGRLKTGTTPRLDGRTIAWSRLTPQVDTVPDGHFSFTPPATRPAPLTCYLAYTNPRTHALIEAARHRSPLATGAIVGPGPRYCPSIEDKVRRFAGRERHLLFLEPEGHGTHRVYPNGLSTSLPADVQVDVVRSIEGLEGAEILQPGYAVEYDFADPRDLGHDLQHRGIRGLFLAGQVNGTSGYEEAAVQGFVAGVSAARGDALRLGRDQAYIGVLVDDLVTRGVGGEPYRMFTSRAEHRLLLREDNADRRLMPVGRSLGLVDDATWEAFQAHAGAIAAGRAALAGVTLHPRPATQALLRAHGTPELTRSAPAEELLRRPEVSYAALAAWCGLPELPARAAEQVEIDVGYAGYVAMAERRAAEARRLEGATLPADVDWLAMATLSHEVRQRLHASRPATLGAMARLPGVTPAAVQVVAAWLAARRSGGAARSA